MSEKTITLDFPVSSVHRLLEAIETPPDERTDLHRAMIRALREQLTAKLHDA